MPAATSDAAFSGRIVPSAVAMLVITTMSGNPVADHSAMGIRSGSPPTWLGPGIHHLGVAEHRDQRAEGRGREGQSDHDGVAGQARRHQDEGGTQPDHQRQPPPRRGEVEWPPADLLEVQLVPGHEDQEGQAQIGEAGHDAVEVGDVENIGTHQDAEADLDHDLRYGQSVGHLGQDRCQYGGDGDQHQCGDGGRPHSPLRRSRLHIVSPDASASAPRGIRQAQATT